MERKSECTLLEVQEHGADRLSSGGDFIAWWKKLVWEQEIKSHRKTGSQSTRGQVLADVGTCY